MLFIISLFLKILVRVYAAGVNPVDTYIRSGNYARMPTLPYSPGFDAAGVVEQIGSEVNQFKVKIVSFAIEIPALILITKFI